MASNINISPLRRTRNAGRTPPRGLILVVSTADPLGLVSFPEAFSQADTHAVVSMLLQIKQQPPNMALQSSLAIPPALAFSPFALPSAPA